MKHEHETLSTYSRCATQDTQQPSSANAKSKILSFLGVCGCLSCYVAMFPAILLGIVGIFGVSSSQTLNALNTYMGSVLFQPILIISILFLIIGVLRYGKIPLSLSIVAGLGIFVSMNFYMQEWLFTLSFVILALAYYLAFQKAKTGTLKIALVLLLAVVVLGIIDLGRSALSTPPNSMDMMTQ